MFSKLSTIIIDSNKVTRKTLASIIRHNLDIKDIKMFENVNLTLNYVKEAQKIDLVFIDHESANEMVFDLVDKINETFSDKKIKFVLIAGNTNKDYLMEASTRGISSFILKPYNSATVVKKTKSLFASKAARKSRRLKIFDVIDAKMAFEEGQFKCTLVDISAGGCQVRLSSFEKKGVELFDIGSINIPNDEVDISLAFELVRLEQDIGSEEKCMLAALKFQPLDQEKATGFAKLWAALLSHGKQE